MFKSITGTGIKAKKVVAATTACCLAVSGTSAGEPCGA